MAYKTKLDLRDASKILWSTSVETEQKPKGTPTPGTQLIQLGCILRIADATDKIAEVSRTVLHERDRYLRERDDARREITQLRRQLTAAKNKIKRLENAQQLTTEARLLAASSGKG